MKSTPPPRRPSKIAVALNGLDRKRHVGYVYVSRDDLNAWATERSRSTVTLYDMRQGAAGLQEALVKRHPAGTYGVFYDPIVTQQDEDRASDKEFRECGGKCSVFDRQVRSDASAPR